MRVPSKRIINLRNKAASRQAIIKAFRTLQKNPDIRRQDAIFIYFAGHGGETRAPAGWETGGNKIQLILPQDTGTKLPSGQTIHAIPDRTISALLNDLSREKGDNVVRPSGSNTSIEVSHWCRTDPSLYFRPSSLTAAIPRPARAMTKVFPGALHVLPIFQTNSR